MKAKELMIGDWVRLNDSYYQIEDVSNNGWVHLLYNNARVHLPTDYIVEYLRPIPLTPEILEKNEFNFGNTASEEDFCYSTGCSLPEEGWCYDEGAGEIKIIFPNESDGGLLRLDDQSADRHLELIFCNPLMVHQLQQALRLCGIDKEIVV